MDLIARIAVAQTAIDTFLFVPFAWGSADCAALAILCLRDAGHPDPLSGLGHRYTTALGAKRVLKRLGHASLEAALDSYGLERIAPAASLPGDIVAMASDDPRWPALGVNVGANRVLGFFDPGTGVGRGDFIEVQAAQTAWRLASCL